MAYLYNIAPADVKCQLYTADEIRAAAENGLALWLNLGDRYPPAKCRLAATVRGWCTVVLERGGIIQDWAGSFTVRAD